MSGGFYKYRCKYFYTHNCPHWVWVRGVACAACLAEGRDADDSPIDVPAWRLSREIFVPQVHDGTLQYTLMEIVPATESGPYWSLKQKGPQPPIPKSAVVMTSATLNPAFLATTGVPSHSTY